MSRTPSEPSLTSPSVAVTGTPQSTGELASSHHHLPLERRHCAHLARPVHGVITRLHANTFPPLSRRALAASHTKIPRRAHTTETRGGRARPTPRWCCTHGMAQWHPGPARTGRRLLLSKTGFTVRLGHGSALSP
jgi:hypothetical protein